MKLTCQPVAEVLNFLTIFLQEDVTKKWDTKTLIGSLNFSINLLRFKLQRKN